MGLILLADITQIDRTDTDHTSQGKAGYGKRGHEHIRGSSNYGLHDDSPLHVGVATSDPLAEEGEEAGIFALRANPVPARVTGFETRRPGRSESPVVTLMVRLMKTQGGCMFEWAARQQGCTARATITTPGSSRLRARD